MLRTLLLALGLLYLSASSLTAQHWTAEEQEIIDLNQSCWNAWAAEDLDAIQRTCNEHVDARGWWTSDAVPEIGWLAANGQRWLDAFGPDDNWIYWEIRPLSVRIFEDTALIHFWATDTHETNAGARTTQTRKQLNIWKRIDGRWTWIGGMAVPEGDRVW